MSSIRGLWLALALAGCGGGYSTAPPPAPPPPPPPPPGGGNPAATANVAMTSSDDGYGTATNTFVPSTVTIIRNGTVTWSNNFGVVHNVTFGTGTGVPANVSNMAMGSVSRSFPAAGTFSYQCTNHQGMGGQVIVQ